MRTDRGMSPAEMQWKMTTPAGTIFLVASPRGFCGAHWKARAAPFAHSLDEAGPVIPHLSQAAKELGEYFAGQTRHFTVALDFSGSPYSKKVWGELAKIHYGATVTYRKLSPTASPPKP